MSKNTRIKREPAKKKEPIAIERPNLDLTIGWNFSRMDTGGKFRCSLKLLDEYSKQLTNLEGISIANILAKQHNHPLGVNKLSVEAQARLDALILQSERNMCLWK